jgi:tetratricopeptide (TPR) repeat protein
MLQINPKNTDALNNIGHAVNQLGRYEEAISYFDKVLSIDPNYAVAQENKKIAQDRLEAESGGGCLIATAAFGSELSPQVQQLRETRDNIVMKTQSGASFMIAFNSVYYSFAPTIADWERQNPIFKEIVKATITPLLSSLTLLQYVDIDSEAEMLGYGVGVILLNIGMYFVAPAFVIFRLKKTENLSSK